MGILKNPAFDENERKKFSILKLETRSHRFDKNSYILSARLKHSDFEKEISVIEPISLFLLDDQEALENIAITGAYNFILEQSKKDKKGK